MIEIPIGSKINKWTVIKERNVSYCCGKRYDLVLCQCECGRIEYVTFRNLYNGTSRQCRHCALEKARAARKVHNFMVIFNGRNMLIDDAIKASGTTLDYKTIRGRMKYGMTFQEVVSKK